MKQSRYSVGLSKHSHHKGKDKFAVFSPDGAQMQGTIKDSREDAQGIADNLNKNNKLDTDNSREE